MIQIIGTKLYCLKYSYPILIIFKQNYINVNQIGTITQGAKRPMSNSNEMVTPQPTALEMEPHHQTLKSSSFTAIFYEMTVF